MTSTATIQTQNSGGQASEYMVTYAPALEGSTAMLTITRLSGEYTDVVNWSTQLAFGLNAAAADDFVATSSSFNLTKNESTTIRIQTLLDSRLEAAEFFYINFYDAEGKQYTNQLKLQISQYITDGPTNVAPDAVNDSIQTSEDTPVIISVLANDTDANRDALSITGTTQPANGQVVVNANGTITYTPYANYNGTDQFTYTASDNKGGTDTATVLVTVNPVNDAPTGTATAVLAAGTEDTAYTVSAATLLQGFSDVDGNILSVTGLSASNGTVTSNNNSTYTVTPTPNYNGLVTLTYTVSDSQGGTAPGQGTFTLAAINDAPTAAAAAESNAGTEDTAISGTLLAGSDIDSPSLTFVKGSSVVGGTVDIDAATGEYTFTPAPNFNGQASFTYSVSDGALSSAEKTVTINVASVNDAPKGAPVAISLPNGTEDIVFTVAAADLLAGFTDVDGDILSVSGLSADHGTVTNNNDGTYTVTPNANYHGALNLTYQVIDSQGGSVSGQQTFTLAAVNDAPAAAEGEETNSTDEDNPATGTLLAGSDIDSATLTFLEGSAVVGGTVEINPTTGEYTFTPAANFNGEASFTYVVSDGSLTSAEKTVTIQVAPINDAPTGAATASLAGGSEDTPYIVSADDLLAGFRDVDGDTLDIADLAASHGSVTNNGNGTYTIAPTANYNGVVQLTYNVVDGNNGSVAGSRNFSLAAVNDGPAGAATAVLLDGTEDTPYIVSADDLLQGFSDVDGNELDVANLAADHGTVLDNGDGTYTLTPDADYNGVVTLSYDVVDGNGGSVSGQQTFSLAATNDLAVLTAPATATFNENVAGPVTVATLSATDVDNADGAFTGEFRIVGGADAGLFTISNNELRYNGSALDFETASKKSFQVQVSAFDGVGDSNMQTVTLSLRNVVERIFTASNDTFDFNANPGGFDRDGQQYDALAGNDTVHLPNMGVVTDWDYGRTFNAGAGDDQIFGGTGSDIVDGGLGHDHLAGGAGSDKLFGKAGDDRLVGGEGNDFLVGGAGADKYTGSSGKDVFIFNSAEEVGKLSGPHDAITDFTQREDLIDLSGIYAGKTVARVVNSSSIKAYEIGYYTQSGKTYVIGDVDGNGTTDFGLELTGAYKLTSSDFILKDSTDFLNKVAGADLSLYNFLHI